MPKRSKKVEQEEDTPVMSQSDDPRYFVMVELDDSVGGYRHYGTFFESGSLSDAKAKCLEKFQKEGKTTLICDREERGHEIVRHEAKELKDDDPAPAEPAKPTRRKRTTRD